MPTMQQICSAVGAIPSQKVLPTGSLPTVNCRNHSRSLGTFHQVFVTTAVPVGTYKAYFVPTGNYYRQLGMFHRVYVPAVVIPGTYKAYFVPTTNYSRLPGTFYHTFVPTAVPVGTYKGRFVPTGNYYRLPAHFTTHLRPGNFFPTPGMYGVFFIQHP